MDTSLNPTKQKYLHEINQVKPDLLLIGITSPKKERFMIKYKDNLESIVTIGVGGLFDVLAGEVPPPLIG